MKKYQNQILIGILAALSIYVGMLFVMDNQGTLQSDEIIEQISQFPLWLVIPLVLSQLMVILFRFLEWHYYLGVIDAKDKISVRDSLIIFVSTLTMVVSPGKAAELLKAVLLKTKTGVPIARSAPIVIAERVVDGLAVIVLMAIALLIAGDDLDLGIYEGIDYAHLSRVIVYSSALAIVAGLIVIQIHPLVYFFLNLLHKIPLLKRLYQPLSAFYESSREIFRLKHVIPMAGLGVGVYLFSSICFIFVLYGIGVEITPQVILQATFITGIVSAVGALSFIPNGAGVTEISNTGMLLALMAPHSPILTPAAAAAAALIQGFFHKWFRVLVGLAVAFIFRHDLFSEQVEQAIIEYEDHEHPAGAAGQG